MDIENNQNSDKKHDVCLAEGGAALTGTTSDEKCKEVRNAINIICYAPIHTAGEGLKTAKIPISADNEWMKDTLEKIYAEITNNESTGEHKNFLSDALPESEQQTEAVLQNRAKYLLCLNRELRFHGMPKEADEVEKIYFTDRLKDKILWEIVYKWYTVLAVEYSNTDDYEEKMKEGDECEEEREKATNKDGIGGSSCYLWAAGIAINNEQNLERFEEALNKAGDARSKYFKREYEGPEITFLAKNAKQVFDVTIPSVKEFVARQNLGSE